MQCYCFNLRKLLKLIILREVIHICILLIFLERESDIEKKGVAKTKGYSLIAKFIYYLQNGDTLQHWFERLSTCLNMAEKDNVALLAVPAFGSGKLFCIILCVLLFFAQFIIEA